MSTPSISKRNLTNLQRYEILDVIIKQEQVGTVNFTTIGQQFEVHRKTVARISSDRETLQEKINNRLLSQKRKRHFKEEDVSDALLLWIKSQQDQGIPLNLSIFNLKKKTTELAQELGRDFLPSDGWVNRFKERHKLKSKKYLAEFEKQNVEETTTDVFKNETLPWLLEKFSPSDIFNADETGLYHRGLLELEAPSSGLLSAGMTDRLTVLVCANMAGTEKQRLLVTGSLKHPTCFPSDLSKLPVTYRNSPSACITRKIFEDYVTDWNESLIGQGRLILLLVDHCNAHLSNMPFSNIEIIVLPSNASPNLWPMEMGVVKNLKSHYRKRLNERILAECIIDDKKQAFEASKTVNLSDAIYMLSDAWGDVMAEIIKNSFARAGMRCQGTEEITSNPSVHLSSEEFKAVVKQDFSLEVCVEESEVNDSDIVQEVKRRKEDRNHREEEGEREESRVIPEHPTKKELLYSVNVMRRFFQNSGNGHALSTLRLMEEDVFAALREGSQESSSQNNSGHPS